MASPQINLRLRDGLDRQLRVRAAELGARERDLVEEALIRTYGFKRAAAVPQDERLPFTPAPPQGEEAASTSGLTPPDSESPPEGSSVVGEPEGGDPAGPEDAPGCPECGEGRLLIDMSNSSVRVCDHCGYRVQRS